jgi:hypothetical protein
MLTTIQGLLNISFPWQIQAQEETAIITWRECSKKSSSPVLSSVEGKATHGLLYPKGDNHCLTRGAYMAYVSTAKWRPACAKRFGEGRERRLACPILKGGPFVFNIPIQHS